MPTFSTNIFKSYDVRGIYPTDLNGDAAYWIGRVLGKRVGSTIVVGRDMRLSGPDLHKELIAGITDAGCNVVDIGLVPIDAVYFTVCNLDYPAGVMITASHNPKEYNGFKMVLKAEKGLDMVRGVDLREEVLALADHREIKQQASGKITERDIYDEYIKHVLGFCDVKKIKPLRVVVDAGNGMAGKVIPLLEKHLPLEIMRMNFDLDGNFPAHPSNPLLPESQEGIIKEVVSHKADLGVIFDGDTDRLFFVDEKGTFIPADMTLLLLAKLLLQREPGAGVAYNVICSRLVPELVTEWGGKPLRSKVGFVNVMEAMRDGGGIMGGELSAHYSFRDNNYADSGFIAFLTVLQLISEQNKSFSELLAPFMGRYYKIPETNLEITDAPKILAALKEKYNDGEPDELDGLTVNYPDWWFNVRASNTEPLLRVTMEGKDKQFIEQKRQELIDFISSAA